MVKGKPWEINEVRYLTQLVDEGKSFDELAKIMVKTDDAIRQKVFDLGLKVKVSLKEKKIDENKNQRIFFSSKLDLPAELPSVEMTVKTLAAALKALDTPGLEKSDVLRLRGIIAGCKVYKELFADYVNYRGLEAELLEGRAKIAELRKKPRALHPNRIFDELAGYREDLAGVEKDSEHQVEGLKEDVKGFFEQVFGFTPYKYQLELADLFEKNQFTAVRWCRQSGKSFSVSALLLKYAWEHPDSYIAIVGPSWRQTKLNIRRMGGFCRKLPQQQGLHVQKTRITLPNGSMIEAFPNNPDTIRGPTFKVIWIEECNFVPNDEELYDAILFTLGTTNGKLIATSTPWNTDSLFWKMFNHKDYEDFARSHVAWNDALEPNGPLKPAIVEKIKRQFGDDPQRWRREMDAEWAEDEDTWLAQSLIVSCVGTVKNCGEDLQEFNPEANYEGDFFAGLDLAQTRDYCVLSVVERLNDKLFLRHLKIFQQPTLYATVLGYLKMLQDRWGGFQKIRVDFTREGPSIIADMAAAGIDNAEGVNFSVPRKSEMASLLKQRMSNHKFFYPLLSWERPCRGDICTELNVERYDLRKDGAIGFSHPNGTHDDVFWATALAVFATCEMAPEQFVTVVPR